jgi:hypothetical protein
MRGVGNGHHERARSGRPARPVRQTNGYDAHLEWLYVQEFGIVPEGARFVVDVELVEDEQGAYYEAILRDPAEVERLQ